VGVISTIAGTGSCGYSGDLGPATAAQLNVPADVATDPAGNVYIADRFNHRIRKLTSATGVITTIAGTGAAGFSGDGGMATAAHLFYPSGVALDAAGNIFIADEHNHRIRKVTAATGAIATVAGNGVQGFTGDGGLATGASLNYPRSIALDAAGNLFIADAHNNRIRKVLAGSSVITTVAGNGTPGFNGDGAALTVSLNRPSGVVADGAGHVYIADQNNNRIRKLTPSTGFLSTVAGTGGAGFSGESGPATAARLFAPSVVDVDAAGNVYVADKSNNRVRKLTAATGLITTVAGNADQGFGGDGGEATAASLDTLDAVAIDTSGRLFITANCRVRRVDAPAPTKMMTTVAGNGTPGFNGDGSAIQASLRQPVAVAVDLSGNLYIADAFNHRVRRVSKAGLISTIAGTGAAGYSGDGGPATAAQLNSPTGVAIDGAGNVFIADLANERIRKITASTGVIATVAGTGSPGFLGDGGPASAARLSGPFAIALDSAANLYIADEYNQRVRRVDAVSGVITTIAGTGVAASGGDGGPANAAWLNNPVAVAIDVAGNIYIAELLGHRVRKIAAAAGVISTFAGDGEAGYRGEGGPATAAGLFTPVGLALDGPGNLYIADAGNDRVRRVSATTGVITTVAGSGSQRAFDPPNFGGDGGAATAAQIDLPTGVAIDAAGNVYIADEINNRVRKAAAAVPEPTNLTASATGATTIRLEWTAAAGASSYTIKRAVGTGSAAAVASGVPGTSFNDTTVLAGALYRYLVTAVGAAGESPGSNEVSIRLTASPVRNDLDGDGRTEIVVQRPSTGQWFVRYSSEAYGAGSSGAISWGLPGDRPISGDFDGDRLTDPAVYRPATGEWFILYSSQGFNPSIYGRYQWGLAGDVPVTADFDGDGRLDLTVHRPSTCEWLIRYSSQNYNAASSAIYQWGLYGDVPLAGDFDRDGKSELSVYRPSTGQWFIRYSSEGFDPGKAGVFQWGLPADMPLIADFDGDGKIDLTVYRPSTNQWFIRYSSLGYDMGAMIAHQWGIPGDLPVILDLDGDGRTELTVFRPSTGEWFVRYSALGYYHGDVGTFQWGLPGDVPMPATYDATARAGNVDGDTKADLIVYRPSTGQWFARLSQNGFAGAFREYSWGRPGDVPLAADFDGDRLTDLTVYRPATGEWFIRYSTAAYSPASAVSYQWGLPGDTPLVADFDGDGKTDLAVFRPSTGQWFIRYSTQGYSLASSGLHQWGLAGDVPLASDADGDGKAELIVFRPSTGQWLIRFSTHGYNVPSAGAYQWGLPGDTPIAADFDGDGRMELTVFRPSSAQWFILYSTRGYASDVPGFYQWGLTTDLPLARDFDGDGRAELTVYRPSTGEWFIRYSSMAYSLGSVGYYQWGLAGDVAVIKP
jgi:trimeric autotransporter adhesin